jgi:hypothetical protein
VSASRARLLLVGILTSIVCLAPPAATSPAVPHATGSNPWVETPTTRRLLARAVHFRGIARHWRGLMGHPRPVLGHREEPFPSLLAERRWLLRRWYAKATAARRLASPAPHQGAWLCIHRYEGPWDDPDAPYYGGLQMDLTFQRMYGRRLLRREGTADRWSPLEQMWVAERALRAGRGFHPWPVSARHCGLI